LTRVLSRPGLSGALLAAVLWLIFTAFPAAVGTVLQILGIEGKAVDRLSRACCWLA